MRVAILVPCYNEPESLTCTLGDFARWRAEYAWAKSLDVEVVVVDDGSTERVLSRHVENAGLRVHLLRHSVNMGQGAALQTALKYARESVDPDLFVTMDADGQHRPEDLAVLHRTLVDQKADIVFGNRFAGEGAAAIPAGRKLMLKAAIRFEAAMTGLKLSDAHNGYRIFTREAARRIDLQQNRMAHATEFKAIVGREGLRYAEAPVRIHYSEELLRKGQKNIGGIRILKDLLSYYAFGGPKA